MVDTVLALPAETKLMVLAPVVRDRKGEFGDLFADMQAQGYVRFRVDGQTVEAADVPRLKKSEKHDIDVVIDRIKVQPGLQQRLAESFEAALRIAEGRAVALEMDGGREHLFSSKFACPVCNYSLSELEPRLFSFNSPVGACPTCDGLGQVTAFDPERVVAHPSLSLASGAVKGWDRRNGYTFSMLESVARHHGFDIDTPFFQLPKKAQKVLLHGSGDEEIEFVYEAEGANGKVRSVRAFKTGMAPMVVALLLATGWLVSSTQRDPERALASLNAALALEIGRPVEERARLAVTHEILLQDGPGGLHRRTGQHGGFEIVAKGGGFPIFTPRFRVKLQDEGDEEREHEEGKEQGDAPFIILSHNSGP